MTEFAAHVEDFCTRLFEDIRKLTADTCGVTREGYTPEEDKVHERLAEAAREIGLEVHADAALNLWMTLPGCATGFASLRLGIAHRLRSSGRQFRWACRHRRAARRRRILEGYE